VGGIGSVVVDIMFWKCFEFVSNISVDSRKFTIRYAPLRTTISDPRNLIVNVQLNLVQ